jgi:hypothetical protein
VRQWLVLTVAVGALAGARLARWGAIAKINSLESIDEPFTVSERAAPFLSLGYRELLADLLYVRLRGYYGGYYDTTSDSLASLGEAIVTVDPYFERVYAFAANAMTIAPHGVDQAIFLRSIALLERGIPLFPRNWPMPLLAGQLYLQDLKTDDTQQRRRWDERGVLLVESAIRKPGAPVVMNADWSAVIRTRLGQRDRAISGLRELLLMTKDPKVQKRLLTRLAMIQDEDATEIAAELADMKKRFESAWKSERPTVSSSMYFLLGRPLGTRFDLVDLATGGRDFLGGDEFERLEPPTDEPSPAP